MAYKFLKLLALIAFLCIFFQACDYKQLDLSFYTSSTGCLDCPKHCTDCDFVSLTITNCYRCSPGYYVNEDRQCSKCYENCEDCDGPTLEECYLPSNGYWYNNATRKIEKISVSGCMEADYRGNCQFCQYGFWPVYSEDNKNIIVACEYLNIEHCSFIHMFSDGKGDCFQCLRSLDYSDNGLCVGNFIDYCSYSSIHDNDTFCSSCIKGYYVSEYNDKCNEGQIDHCDRYEYPDICLYCEWGYAVSYDGKSCVSCSDYGCNCIYCNYEGCSLCEMGYYVNEFGVCDKCMEYCHDCTNDSICDSCENGYYKTEALVYDANTGNSLSQQECKKCLINNCMTCVESDFDEVICDKCEPGYRLESSECAIKNSPGWSDCPSSCGRCDGYMKYCSECPLEKILYKEFNYQSQSIEWLYTCIDFCLPTDKYGKHNKIIDEMGQAYCTNHYSDYYSDKYNFKTDEYSSNLHLFRNYYEYNVYYRSIPWSDTYSGKKYNKGNSNNFSELCSSEKYNKENSENFSDLSSSEKYNKGNSNNFSEAIFMREMIKINILLIFLAHLYNSYKKYSFC